MIHDDPLAAFEFNRAVWLWGTSLEAELNHDPKPSKEAKKDQLRRTRILNKWIPKAPDATEEKPKPSARMFADPRPTK